MFDIEFVDARTGQPIATADRCRGVPSEGHTVTLEHAVFGPAVYRVTRPADHWFRARSGRLGRPDQYIAASVKVYLERVGDPT